MNHKQKISLSKKLRSPQEGRNGVAIFQTKFWERRKKLIAERVSKKSLKK